MKIGKKSPNFSIAVIEFEQFVMEGLRVEITEP